ncbi:MAG: U32 family peptidase C-terminal domain-containing protein [Candidatus Gastranaerophilales bacterium]|nr:U32 family peptidase C-terminal domain-containing protein [Candidatus Gastranaerophilales bacterium]
MKKPELLLPAGSKEKMEYAIHYGADAVYLGMADFSLRAMRKGELITLDNLKDCIDLAHSFGKKVYLTLNIFAYDSDIKQMTECAEKIKDAAPDAILFSDFGVYNVIKKYMPEIPIHVSTQTNILNYEAVKFWQNLGAQRVVLSRDLSLSQIEEIKNKVPDMELEVFVHGAQCVSFSGRCLISDYMTKGERKANHGNCSQSCRWSYKLVEETRPGEYFDICENERGTHILSPKDIALINYLPQLIDIGVDSFKIEGRTKSLYYVAAIAKAYKKSIDSYLKYGKIDEEANYNEIVKIGNRGYTTGFYLHKPDSEGYSYDISKGLAGADCLCVFTDKKDNLYKVITKNKFLLNDEIEIITPDECFRTKVTKIYNEKMSEEKKLSNTNDISFIELSNPPVDYHWALARTIGVKNLR